MGVKIQRPGDPGHPGGNRRIYVRVNFTPRGVSRGQARQEKIKTRLTRVFTTTKAADTYAAQIEAWLKIGDVGRVFAPPDAHQPARPTFAATVEAWREKDTADWKPSTRRTYEDILAAHLLPAFKCCPGGSETPRAVGEITAAEIETWWAALRRGDYSTDYLVAVRAVLRSILQRAVKAGWLVQNPTDAIMGKISTNRPDEHGADWLTGPELGRLLEAAQRHEPGAHPAMMLTAAAGLRWGEVQGLQVGDVDLARARLYVRRAIYKGAVSTPKGGRFRVVDLPASVVGVLRDWLRTIEAEAAVRGGAPTWLFPGRDGAPLAYHVFRASLTRAAKAAGLGRPVRPHLLRHSYASLALERGVPLLTVSRQLGHKSIQVTADIYGHQAEGAGRQAAEALETVLSEGQIRNLDATPARERA